MPFHKSTDPLNVVVHSPPCRHLLSKGMYVLGKREPSPATDGMGDGNCWCGQTQRATGPDDQFVKRSQCVPTRKCYEAVI